MKKTLAAIALVAAFNLAAHAQTVGDAVHEGAQEVEKGAKEVEKVVWTHCADGRKTVKGKTGCNGHGGVAHPQPKPKPKPEPEPDPK